MEAVVTLEQDPNQLTLLFLCCHCTKNNYVMLSAKPDMTLVGTELHGSSLWDGASRSGALGMSKVAVGKRLVFIIMDIY